MSKPEKFMVLDGTHSIRT